MNRIQKNYINVNKILLAVLVLGASACTGPFGMVVGSSEIHEKYNDRIRIINAGESISKSDRAKLNQLVDNL